MRYIIVSAFISLDGVMQAPGGPEEDTSGGFSFGGWTFPYWDDALAEAMEETFSSPFDLLLGRKTYDIFAAHWPLVETDPQAENYNEENMLIADQFNQATKYVATHRPESLNWENSEPLGSDIVKRLQELKNADGKDLMVQGSSELVHQLFAHGLVDQLRLLTYPVILGVGKRLFDKSSNPTRFKLQRMKTSPSGVIMSIYERDGKIETGSFA
ncbi:dihydrofolate reductase family protein [Falsochrobactrum ovis]|uniref:Dihydrofolate reductase n=1 Tax=Falsochrobactrum ovis TaxID=1293442 RepID=A0A364JZI7_9HYPH|nr:dihydrofolate reductase family protein [Falsochrobactrum ovis]RAK33981.1 dihydrofolate reductase [Falsochrobactrum ovis]